jgi:hypothetical protein
MVVIDPKVALSRADRASSGLLLDERLVLIACQAVASLS